ncbi:MAG: hypothetical protein AVDCRST_MAG30-2197 [uncultured Solirubrobacteraceae bacterium]|uniref:Uncharacterized protein n=1 Tax=uncultured Solirubrobacteraceae bacterium TaxID=1162706 RepID=A0A6J4SV33_9ACTN|nr:MAG: hypothetical protein AVDCRST_MAG30-2197 [uncultured Solirubrobacteraceae bacterium]
MARRAGDRHAGGHRARAAVEQRDAVGVAEGDGDAARARVGGDALRLGAHGDDLAGRLGAQRGRARGLGRLGRAVLGQRAAAGERPRREGEDQERRAADRPRMAQPGPGGR